VTARAVDITTLESIAFPAISTGHAS
jgi:O-acetyl-ADP-ribose deacetylase (regulator of RNase III)